MRDLSGAGRSTASDEEVKKAYRNLARKYHPDNYHDNPLADLAQERMKEINEAYEEIQTQRRLRRKLRCGIVRRLPPMGRATAATSPIPALSAGCVPPSSRAI